MSDNKDGILERLTELNLSIDEAKIYIELIKEPNTHLRLSRITGINRTKVYRIVEQLIKRSLVSKRSDDRGTFLVATNYSALEIELVNQEEKNKQQRLIFQNLVSELELLKKQNNSRFTINTYEGIEGFKQMLWNELKTQRELLSLGYSNIELFVPDHYWSKKYRSLVNQACYKVFELKTNIADPVGFTKEEQYMKNYFYRLLDPKILPLNNQTVIYNNTTAIYHWRNNQRVGLEIINKPYTDMMRGIFKHLWQIAKAIK